MFRGPPKDYPAPSVLCQWKCGRNCGRQKNVHLINLGRFSKVKNMRRRDFDFLGKKVAFIAKHANSAQLDRGWLAAQTAFRCHGWEMCRPTEIPPRKVRQGGIIGETDSCGPLPGMVRTIWSAAFGSDAFHDPSSWFTFADLCCRSLRTRTNGKQPKPLGDKCSLAALHLLAEFCIAHQSQGGGHAQLMDLAMVEE